MSTTTPAEILDAALKLPANDRERIARELINSVSPPGIMSEDDPGFLEELDRRSRAHSEDPSRASSWDEVRERIADRLEQQRSGRET